MKFSKIHKPHIGPYTIADPNHSFSFPNHELPIPQPIMNHTHTHTISYVHANSNTYMQPIFSILKYVYHFQIYFNCESNIFVIFFLLILNKFASWQKQK